MTYIVSGGTPTAVGSKAAPVPTTKPYSGLSPTTIALLRGDGAYLTLWSIFKSQPLVFAVIMKRAKALARTPLFPYVVGADGSTHERQPAHPLTRLLRRPYDYASAYALKAVTAIELGIYGEAIWLKVRPTSRSVPGQVWPIPMRYVTVLRDELSAVGFKVTTGGKTTTITREQAVYFESPGGSPLLPLARTLALEDAALTWQSQSLGQGMTKRGAFTTDSTLREGTFDRLRDELTKLYAGVENAGKLAILDQGLKFTEIGTSAVDADLINQRKLSREEVCAAYDMHPTLLGLAQAVYAATVEHRRQMYDSIGSDMVLFEETVQTQLVDVEPSWDGIEVAFDLSDLLRPDPETRARLHLLNQQAGVDSINERRKAEHLPQINDPLADAVLMPVNMVPVGEGVDPTTFLSQSGGTPAQGVADQVTTAAIREALLGEAANGDKTGTLVPSEED